MMLTKHVFNAQVPYNFLGRALPCQCGGVCRQPAPRHTVRQSSCPPASAPAALGPARGAATTGLFAIRPIQGCLAGRITSMSCTCPRMPSLLSSSLMRISLISRSSVAQVVQLLFILALYVPTPSLLLVQNPPSIPALPMAWLAARLRGGRLVVDWHNYGFTILQLKLEAPERHWLVRLAQW